VVSAAEELGFQDDDVAKIEMAVGEACTNIIEHAYLTKPLRDEIELWVESFPDRLEITSSIIPLSTSP
jgi:serine/threonine-protein kinase RsbW